MGREFLDTNIFVYALDEDEEKKRDRARQILKALLPTGRAVTSTQILSEFFSVVTRKLALDVGHARAQVEMMARLDVVQVSAEIILEAIDFHERHRVAYWDALVIRCAVRSGCDRLLSEDMQDGQVIDGVEIVNPFAREDD